MAFNYYTLFGLLLLATRCASEHCDAKEKTSQQLCKSFDILFKQDNGKLAKYICGCGTAFIKADYSYCHARDYDFKDAPECGRTYQSIEYEKICKSSNFASNFVTYALFKTLFRVCKNDNPKLMKLSNSVFKTGIISKVLDFVVKRTFETETANLLISCYVRLQEIATFPNSTDAGRI